MNAMGYVWLVGLIGVMVACVWVFVRTWRRSQGEIALAKAAAELGVSNPGPFVMGGESSPTPESTPPISAGVPSVKRSGGAYREQRAQDVKERSARGVCLYCENPAEHTAPRAVIQRSLFDGLYRYLNVVPMSRVRIDTSTPWPPFGGIFSEKGAGPTLTHCPYHHTLARGRWERWIANRTSDYARLVEEQNAELYEFDRYALDEQMKDEAEATLARVQRPRQRASKAPASNGPLAVVRGGRTGTEGGA